MKQFKSLAVLLAVLLFALPLTGAASPKAAPLGSTVQVAPGYDYTRFMDAGITLNVYNWGDYISDGGDVGSMDVNAEFEKLTGIRVNYTNFDTNESLYSKLKSGGGDYDVIFPSDYMIGRMVAEGMLAPLNFDNIPNYRKIGEQYKDLEYDPQNMYSVPYTWGYVGIVYNTTMVDEVVDSWSILWNEKYAGNILMFDNSRDAFGIAAKMLGMPINPTSTEDIDKMTEALKQQRPLVQAYVMDQIYDKMGGGEAALAPYYAGDAITMMADNSDLAFAVPKEGTNYFVDAMCIPATCRNQEAAEMYINFICETPVAVANTLYIGYSTPQVEAENVLPAEVRNNPIAYPSDEMLANTETFSVLSPELGAYMDSAWTEVRSDTGPVNISGGGVPVWVIPAVLAVAAALAGVVIWRKKAAKKRNEMY